MTNLYMVRHAHSVYTTDEWKRPLSEKGRHDAAKVTEILKEEGIAAAISSPYQRAIQTIAGAADYFGLPIELEDGFKERLLSPGPVADFSEAIQRVWENPEFCLPGGESNLAAQKRGIVSLFDVLKRYEGQNVVIGTHGNIMVLIMNYFDAAYDFSFWKSLQMPDVYKLSFSGMQLKGAEGLWTDR